MSAIEHTDVVAFTGKTRWWTMTNEVGTLEIVRVVFHAANGDYDALEAEAVGASTRSMVWWLTMPPGVFAHPPLAASALRWGDEGRKGLRDQGVKIAVLGVDARAMKLEMRFIGN